MKIPFIVIIFIIGNSFYAKANQDCIWKTSKAGITIHYIAPCDFRNNKSIDSFLNKLISSLNRQDTSLKILAIVNHQQLSFPDGKFPNFFSIAYDTLRLIDDDYIFKYYWDQGNSALLDINVTDKKGNDKLGIKIIYDKDYRLGQPVWIDIFNAIVYASNNVELIKKSQKRDTVRYNTNGWYVSLLTLDKFSINKILGRPAVSSHRLEKKNAESSTSQPNYLILGLISLLLMGVIIIAKRKHSR